MRAGQAAKRFPAPPPAPCRAAAVPSRKWPAQTGQLSPRHSCCKRVAISAPETIRAATKMTQRRLDKSLFFRFIIAALLSFISGGYTCRSSQAESCFRYPAIRSHRFSAAWRWFLTRSRPDASAHGTFRTGYANDPRRRADHNTDRHCCAYSPDRCA